MTVKWGRLSIDDQECTSCFGGSHQFAGGVGLKKGELLLGGGPPVWNLICTENCPVGALSVTADTPNLTDGAAA